MRWDNFRRSSNVEQGESGGSGMPSGGFRLGGGRLGIGAIVVILLLSWGLGIDPRVLIDAITNGGTGQESYVPDNSSPGQGNAGQGSLANYPGEEFVAAVLGDTEDRWTEILGERNVSYTAPKLVLFSGSTRSACGRAESAMGPFYCPNDERIYLDTEFFDEIQTRLGGCPAGSKTCEFAQAYVIAHEVGHHVQDVLGILPKAEQMQQNAGEAEANQIQVRVELQADCFAGLWANRSQAKLKFLEDGDVDAALQTASAIGDDTLQKRAQGYAVPDSFTHGTSAERKRWFSRGLQSGQLSACDTFSSNQL
jgi:predicted metalloprotease